MNDENSMNAGTNAFGPLACGRPFSCRPACWHLRL